MAPYVAQYVFAYPFQLVDDDLYKVLGTYECEICSDDTTFIYYAHGFPYPLCGDECFALLVEALIENEC